jgi:ATP-dependent Lhr-like helicase
MFESRWRWNTTISLAVPRSRAGRKVPPPLQRMLADDLLAAVFPDAAACLENIPGDRQLPDHPLVSQTIRDCLDGAMDLAGLSKILHRIHAGQLRLITRDTPEPSPLSHEILNARPYAFLDDAPLEERRTQAVQTRRSSEPSSRGDLGALDPSAIDRVRDEARPDPRDADELHDALMTSGFLTAGEAARLPTDLFESLSQSKRAALIQLPGSIIWVAADRLPEIAVLQPSVSIAATGAEVPPSRIARSWTRDAAATELVRSRLALIGPTTSSALGASLGVERGEIDGALLALESEGVVLRGRFTSENDDLEWCDRRLLARIHRYTLNRLRAEIEPVPVADFQRFLFAWQGVSSSHRFAGIDGLRSVLFVLDGLELPASAWERVVLPARLDRYNPAWLDMLCLTGEIAWARLSLRAPIAGDKPGLRVALFPRDHAPAWHALRPVDDAAARLSDAGRRALESLRTRGPSFIGELAKACSLDDASITTAIAELALAGLAVSDGFAGVRAAIRTLRRQPAPTRRQHDGAGRWSAVNLEASDGDREAAVETHARALLARYGIVFRRLLTRETNAAPWRVLTSIYRRLEARGEIRGGRFVTGMSGEQFALPEAVERLRELRRAGHDGALTTISGVDPLNLTGILTAGDRVRSASSTRLVYRDGVALAALEGEYMRPLAEIEPHVAARVATALAGRAIPVVTAGFIGR